MESGSLSRFQKRPNPLPRAAFAVLAMFIASLNFCLGQQLSQSAAAHDIPPVAALASHQPSPQIFEDAAAERALLNLANQRRREADAPPLYLNQNLTNAARAHALLMVDRQQLSHQFEGEALLMPRLLATGLRIDRVGENVAYNSSIDQAFEALMQSAPHRRNLLDPNFNSAGFAVFWSSHRLYLVQDFAHLLPTMSQTSLP